MHDYWLAVILGIIEGVTEFLPISSTGHMLLAEHVLGVELDKDAFWKLFTIVIQLGAILSVVVYYWKRICMLVTDFIHPGMISGSTSGAPAFLPIPRWRHPLVLVLLAVVPAGVVGMLAKKHIDHLMEFALPIGIALIVGAFIIEWIERLTWNKTTLDDLTQVTPLKALGIGVAQVFSLVPGVSRSAATIMGGLLCGLTRRNAADFSFLLSIPTMTAATVYSLYKFVQENPMPSTDRWLVLGAGFATAFVVALVVVAWFLRFIQTHTFRLFNIYRILLGLIVIAAWMMGKIA